MSYVSTTTLALDPSYSGASLRIQYYEIDPDTLVKTPVGSPVSTGIEELAGGDGLFEIALVAQDGLLGWARIYDNVAPTVILASVPINPRELEYSDVPTSDVVDDIAALSASTAINLINVVNGGTITVYRSDTWHFQITVGAGIVLTDYEVVALVAKQSRSQADDDATLYVRSDAAGLVRIGGAAPSAANTGSLIVNSATQFTVHVNMAETVNVQPTQKLTWWVKLFDTTPTPDEGYTRVTGVFVVENYALRATA